MRFDDTNPEKEKVDFEKVRECMNTNTLGNQCKGEGGRCTDQETRSALRKKGDSVRESEIELVEQ